MKTLFQVLGVIALAALLAPAARAADVPIPNINKRGDNEKEFVQKTVNAIVHAARSSIKTATVDAFEKKKPKEGQEEWHIKAGYKGVATGKAYTATIVVLIDTSAKDKWDVVRIDYDDNNSSPIGFNRKNVQEMRKKLNGN